MGRWPRLSAPHRPGNNWRSSEFIRASPARRPGRRYVASSISEQGGAGLDRLSEPEFARFHQLNNAYREKFHVPFIVCVRRHTKESILRQFERLQNAPALSLKTVGEICRIAALRLRDFVEAADILQSAAHRSHLVFQAWTRGGACIFPFRRGKPVFKR
jgi:hypothetical protein